MSIDLSSSLTRLIGLSVIVSACDSGLEHDGSASLRFSDRTLLRCDYWRLSQDGVARLSSFDHNQQYGLPAPIDAVSQLKGRLTNDPVASASCSDSGDLHFAFDSGNKFVAFNFTGYEVWEISFPDGTGQYSNYV